MRRWLREAAAAATLVSERPDLWLSGALAWAVTVGPLVLLVAVLPVPSVADLTFYGARFVSSGSWPWNAVATGAAVVVAAAIAVGLATLADAVLATGGRRVPSLSVLARSVALSLIGLAPAVVLLGWAAVAVAHAAPLEFGTPEAAGGPIVATVLRVAPVIGLLAVGVVVGAAYGATARHLAVRHSLGLRPALVAALSAARARPGAVGLHAVLAFLISVAYAVFALVLLRVLWAPVGEQLEGGAGLDPGAGTLLVGFVAIWLCLVLGGGAQRAWGSAAWARLLSNPPPADAPAKQRKETPSTP